MKMSRFYGKQIARYHQVDNVVEWVMCGIMLFLINLKQNTEIQDNKDLVMDDNGNTVRQNTGVSINLQVYMSSSILHSVSKAKHSNHR